MDFLPDTEQEAIRRALRELCARRFPPSRLGETAFDPGLWAELASFGVFSLVEDGLGTAVLAAEELGRALVPGPLVGTMLTPLLPGLPATGPVAVLEQAEPGAVPVTAPAEPSGLPVTEASEPSGGGGAVLVEHSEVLAALVVLDADGVSVLAGDEVRALAGLRRLPEPVDPLTPLAEVTDLPAGRRLGGPAEAAALRRAGTVLTAALQTGIAAACTDLAVAYARVREQFGRPIGSFQAVQHLCADMLARAEVATAAVRAAAVVLDDPATGDRDRAVPAAKILADDAAAANAKAAVQVHGGMGFTWDVPVHWYLKRSWVHAARFGTADEHADALAALL